MNSSKNILYFKKALMTSNSTGLRVLIPVGTKNTDCKKNKVPIIIISSGCRKFL